MKKETSNVRIMSGLQPARAHNGQYSNLTITVIIERIIEDNALKTNWEEITFKLIDMRHQQSECWQNTIEEGIKKTSKIKTKKPT